MRNWIWNEKIIIIIMVKSFKDINRTNVGPHERSVDGNWIEAQQQLNILENKWPLQTLSIDNGLY